MMRRWWAIAALAIALGGCATTVAGRTSERAAIQLSIAVGVDRLVREYPEARQIVCLSEGEVTVVDDVVLRVVVDQVGILVDLAAGPNAAVTSDEVRGWIRQYARCTTWKQAS